MNLRKKDIQMDKGSHSVYSLNYHLILVVKYRRKVIDDEISDKLKDIFIEYGKLHEVELLEWEHDKDHIHALIKTTPKITLSKFIGNYKSYSSRVIKNSFPRIKNNLWGSAFWTGSYCIISVGGASLEILKTYIQNQGGG